MSDRPHGYARYRLDGCRCDVCKEARRAYDRQQVYNRANGVEVLVDAEPARQHVRALRAAGMGLRQIAAAANLNRKILNSLMNGRADRGTKPTGRIRPETAGAILAVPMPTVDTLAGKTLVSAIGVQRRLQALVAVGWSQNKLAELLGMTRSNFGTFMNEKQITAANARRALTLYARLENTAPPEDEHRDKIAASRARRHAARRGWFPAIAWDDDTIDDPAAHPNMTGYDEAKVQALLAGQETEYDDAELVEVVRRLPDLTLTAIAARIGLTYNALYYRVRTKVAS